ncbi:putative uncharacterized protein [Waddlia chondrophila 2032/99]|uniref:M23ase beta-sheet core domain-containing protein n=2 Tax=Waddlia chondrophila TaxID=71667 RepID=D6YUM4_WADCW|nr:M23 family metallopeptidase [Waddlia chondrophila]ADI37836.1 conserved hypothetical protein [Waddlia chondrophila WSU 86-1044]CCB91999.1 putative uncharacterized protein [Waddlia chondrophila 2032/99]
MNKSWIFLLCASLSLASCQDRKENCSKHNEDQFTPILAEIFEPTPPFPGTDNKYHLLYGLRLTNAGNLPAQLESIEVLDGCEGKVVQAFSGNDLLSNLAHLNATPAESGNFDIDSSRIFFVKLAFDQKEKIPGSLKHRLKLKGSAGPGSKSQSSLTYEAGSFCVCKKDLPALALPLRGKGWIVFNGCCSSAGAHQNSLLPVNGTLYNAQRYAIDFMKLDDKGTLYSGDPSVPSNWHCYNEKVYAVEDGLVISVLEGLEDQPPGALPDPNSITLKTVTGNHIILKLSSGVYAFYAHLKKGSIRVKEGNSVSKGDEIARVGNSGNTSAPHLHLHLMDAPSPIGSNPVAYTYDRFKLAGLIEENSFYEHENLDALQVITIPDEWRNHQLPLDLNILESD